MRDVDLVGARMRSLRLTGPGLGSPRDVVGWLGAVQSQDYRPATWAVAQRLSAGAHEPDLDAAYAAGDLLRTHVLRPTWHFVLPADIRWLLTLTGPRVHVFNRYYARAQGVDASTRRTAERLISRALAGGGQMTRAQLAAVLAGGGVAAESIRLGLILMSAELDGLICSGAPRGRQHTYALLEERVPAVPPVDPDAALARFVRGYFASHGPATVKDLGWWSSLTLTQIRAGIDAAGSSLASLRAEGLEYWFDASLDGARPVDPDDVQLLQAYDEYIVGYTQSKFLLDLSGVARAATRGRSAFNHVLLVGGQVAGCWRRKITREAVHLEVVLYTSLTSQARARLEAAAAAHGRYLGLDATLAEASV